MPKADFRSKTTSPSDGIVSLVQRRGCEPTYVVRCEPTGGLYAALWALSTHRITSECQAEHILVYQIAGQGPASKAVGNKAHHARTRPGMITLVPRGEHAQYAIENNLTALELYIAPRLLHRYAERNLPGGGAVSLRPLFAVEDPWLTGYFKMLTSELETFTDSPPQLDSLLFGQAQELLFKHLLRHYSEEGRAPHYALPASDRAAPLRPHLLRRVVDFIHANLASELRLTDLAELAHLSENHFIRSFHAATGCTPYQFVLEQRLSAGAERLRRDNAASIAAVAKSLGFKSQANFATKFKARYGVTPSFYRRKCGG